MEASKINTMNELANYINACEDWPLAEFNEIIARNGWIDDSGETWGVCHNDNQKIVMNDQGEAEVINID